MKKLAVLVLSFCLFGLTTSCTDVEEGKKESLRAAKECVETAQITLA